jgi:hypothetical protein
MSDPKDVSRPRTPLTLSPKTPRPATPHEEMARKMYGGTSTPHSAAALARALSDGVESKPLTDHSTSTPHSAAALARALSAGFDQKTVTDHAHALAASLRAGSPTVSSDDLGILGEPTMGPGMAMLGLGGGMRPLNEILGQSPASDFGGPSEKYQRFTLKRDRDRPLAFDGRIVAEVEEKQFADQVVIRAAIYETQGGKFVTEMTRREVNPPANYGEGKRPFLFAKATVFESLDIAAMSFRTHGGRLTEELLRQIGDVDPEFIE